MFYVVNMVLNPFIQLTFIVRTFNSVFVLKSQKFLCDGPLNRYARLTINGYIL